MTHQAATDDQKAEVRQMIDACFRFAGVAFTWNGIVNDQVAAVFGTRLAETAKCSRAVGLIPCRPVVPLA